MNRSSGDGVAPVDGFAATGTRGRLQLQFGHATGAVPGKTNEDFHGIVTPLEESEAHVRGIAAAIADGVSGNGAGRLASEPAVKTLLRDFYAAPAAWNLTTALDKLLQSINAWLYSENSRHPEHEGRVTTLTFLLFKDNCLHIAHVGDTRVYRRRGEVITQLTIDHTWQRSDMRHVLKRALGLDSHLVADYSDGELMPGDVFIMASDGVWEVLGERVIAEVMRRASSMQSLAEELVERSIRNQVQYMGRNDATAIAISVGERTAGQ